MPVYKLIGNKRDKIKSYASTVMYDNIDTYINIIDEMIPYLLNESMIIDITTHKSDGSIEILQKLESLLLEQIFYV